ncbi:hypothetical protein BCR42DRAFT_411848 [Absidia repens]|uniref:Uncharacterized protein n=1 Tax=Absidia repens TaxID=90262 RepID=A0A1X2IMC8_9FUNG|nr:hypothetical protein BCR42DRAFT_411848 [Absidia repens]
MSNVAQCHSQAKLNSTHSPIHPSIKKKIKKKDTKKRSNKYILLLGFFFGDITEIYSKSFPLELY